MMYQSRQFLNKAKIFRGQSQKSVRVVMTMYSESTDLLCVTLAKLIQESILKFKIKSFILALIAKYINCPFPNSIYPQDFVFYFFYQYLRQN